MLVADDEEDIRALVAFRLKRAGYEVIIAADGEEALLLATTRLPDLAVLDMMMPKATGLEVTRSMREQATTKEIPVILLTARAHRLEPGQLNQTGIRQVLDKPFSVREVIARAEELTRIPAGRK